MSGSWLGRSLKSKWTFLLVSMLSFLGGCGSSGPGGGDAKHVYSSPSEVDQKKADLYDAMKGGAYGSAGRASAPQVDPNKK